MREELVDFSGGRFITSWIEALRYDSELRGRGRGKEESFRCRKLEYPWLIHQLTIQQNDSLHSSLVKTTVDTPIAINVTSCSRCRSDARGANVHKQDVVWKEHVFENTDASTPFFILSSLLPMCAHHQGQRSRNESILRAIMESVHKKRRGMDGWMDG